MRLIGKDRCLVVLDDGTLLKIYIEHINHLALAVDSDRSIKRFHLEKLGDQSLFSLDETKRLFAILSVETVSHLECPLRVWHPPTNHRPRFIFISSFMIWMPKRSWLEEERLTSAAGMPTRQPFRILFSYQVRRSF